MSVEYVTVIVGGQLFGAAVRDIHDVFSPVGITPVPMAPADVAGVLNLRGRIITMIDLCARLGMSKSAASKPMAIGVERQGEVYGLLVDKVGEVMRLDTDTFENNPVNMDPRWADVTRGVHRLDGRLLIILDIDRLLKVNAIAA
jgi:purine-binding chemotaxis protein CheW